MRAIHRVALMPAVCVAILACRSPQRPTLAAATSDRCRAEVEGADLSRWREARGDGFTFCVPANWQVMGRVAQRGEARIEWNVGVPAGDPAARVLGTGEVVYDKVKRLRPGNPTESIRFSEPIDGRPAELYREALGVKAVPPKAAYLTGAQWLGPAVHFAGEATELSTADMQFLIYRTVRFGPS